MSIAMLSAARRGRSAQISANPTTLSVLKPTLVDNGYKNYGLQYITAAESIGPVRVCHIKKDIPEKKETPTPDTVIDSFYLISNYGTPLDEGWKFSYNGREFITRKAEVQREYAGIIGYRAHLDDTKSEAVP